MLTGGFKSDILMYAPPDEQDHWLGYVYELENDQMYSNSARTKAELERILWDWRKNNWAEWHTWEDQED